MELHKEKEDFVVMGIQVRTFPKGIKEAFETLMQTLGARDYYGISWMDENDNIIYYAAGKELFTGESRQYKFEKLKIDKGNYQTEAIHNWQSKTDCIKDVFQKLMGDKKPDSNNPCIEWYHSPDDMLCMIRI